ncbi:hypothetical protein [Methylobacterium nodulans]|uniref:17 kDa surface antigen n=1 Tax=Methylobacterium nodulans (strain LMG 21967 / CNCM I-2342 / ORS 2060) TaxID=460265 RepID=B8IB94_METNO|nr:hypothetical protein [Methylobacterium nodulans]ACL57309.1 conserved hypothetical protein [Methylobacterium nodulans ORS 2060]
MKRVLLACSLGAAIFSFAGVAQAQGIIGGAEEGAARGNRAAGPIGAIVGGAIGAGVGGVNGALGIRPYRRVHYGPRHYRHRHYHYHYRAY